MNRDDDQPNHSWYKHVDSKDDEDHGLGLVGSVVVTHEESPLYQNHNKELVERFLIVSESDLILYILEIKDRHDRLKIEEVDHTAIRGEFYDKDKLKDTLINHLKTRSPESKFKATMKLNDKIHYYTFEKIPIKKF